jgi:hypothetical protein
VANEDDVRRLALELPGVIADERHGQRHYAIEGKGIAWAYVARDQPKAKRTLRPGIAAIRCPIEEKEMLIEAAPAIYFDDDHYRGFPGVLVRLDAISEAELSARLARAFEIQAPKRRRR